MVRPHSQPKSRHSARARAGAPAAGHLLVAFALLTLGLLLPSCAGMAQGTGASVLAIMPGVINRADNKSLRFAMLKYGLDTFCQEMLKRGAPLKLADDQPSVGRFYPQHCDTRLIDEEANRSFLVQFSGAGYAFTNITQRIGFDASGVVEYDPDFLLDDATMYLYFRTKHVASTSFQAGMIENGVANMALVLAPGGFAERFGQQVVAAELTRGFTVIRRGDGTVDFGLGLIEKGKMPFHPYQIKGDARTVLANERIEVHARQREFLGPFEVDSQGRALFLTVGVDGAEGVDVMVVPKDAGEQWLSLYIHQPMTTPPAYPPLLADVALSAQPYRKMLPVGKGRYYLVIDNTATAGRIAPPPNPFDDRAALVNYAVELGDAP
ncbi:MAG TPA: hypothetical protein VK540_02890 [Polyangiaceae bacterium]|nr:hypothetical protein [Polyangiaceae bacterium]